MPFLQPAEAMVFEKGKRLKDKSLWYIEPIRNQRAQQTGTQSDRPPAPLQPTQQR